ncbi:MAG: ATP-binding protein [Rhizomicrobium sp.]
MNKSSTRSLRPAEARHAATVETSERTIGKLLRQQAALADFGSFAFREGNLVSILNEAARICAASLDVPFAKVCRYRADHNDLLVEAGVGWNPGVVGYVVSAADETTTQGRAYITGQPVILEDLSKNDSYTLPGFYAEHGIVAMADVLIKGHEGPWGILEVDSPATRHFDHHDINFLTGFANVLAEAASTTQRTVSLRAAIGQKEALIVQKDELVVELRDREQKLLDMQAELLHTTRLNAMGQMTAAIAHELNQPLTAIANYLSAAKRTLQAETIDAKMVSRSQDLIGRASKQTHRAGGIIKNLRRFVEKRESARSRENLRAVITKALALTHNGLNDASMHVTFDLDPTLPDVLIDPVQIQQVLTNLIGNSVQAMRGCAKQELLLATCRGEAGFVNVTVRDSGPGLPAEIASRIFQPFVPSKSNGMGLGLMICDVLVKANGGRIWLIEGLPEGTGFCFSLPLMPAVAAAA